MSLRRSNWIGCIVLLFFAFIHTQQSFASLLVTDIFNDWTHGASPIDHTTTGAWYVDGNTIRATLNHSGSLVSDFTASTNYSFSVDTRSDRDNDTFGLMWGVQDLANHYRFTWAINQGESGIGTPTTTGADAGFDGFKIVKEVAGTSSILYFSDTEYVIGNDYNVSVTGTATGFDVVIKDLTGNVTIFDQAIADTTYTSGKVGIHELFQAEGNTWSNFHFEQGDGFSTVPEPTSIAMWGMGVLGMAGYGWRRRRRAA